MAAVTVARPTKLLHRHDPMGLTAMGAPEDEYEPEAGTIAPRLADAATEADVQRIIAEEFTVWFGAEIAPSHETLTAPAAEVRALLDR